MKTASLWRAGGAATVTFLLIGLLRGAEAPSYGFWTAAQMADFDRQLVSSMDATKTSRVDLMPTDHSYFTVIHREAGALTGEVHQRYADFGVVRSGQGAIIAGGRLVGSRQSGPGELRGRIEGGTLHSLKAGDAFYVPAGVPQQFVIEATHHLRVEMLKVERQPGDADLPAFMFWDAAALLQTESTLKGKMNEYYSAVEDFIKNDRTQFHMNHKEGTAESEIHDHWAEFQIIRNGEGTMMLGGTVANAKVIEPGETRGTTLDGAIGQPLRAGDLLYIPAGTPHQTVVDRTKSQDKLIVKVWVP